MRIWFGVVAVNDPSLWATWATCGARGRRATPARNPSWTRGWPPWPCTWGSRRRQSTCTRSAGASTCSTSCTKPWVAGRRPSQWPARRTASTSRPRTTTTPSTSSPSGTSTALYRRSRRAAIARRRCMFELRGRCCGPQAHQVVGAVLRVSWRVREGARRVSGGQRLSVARACILRAGRLRRGGGDCGGIARRGGSVSFGAYVRGARCHGGGGGRRDGTDTRRGWRAPRGWTPSS